MRDFTRYAPIFARDGVVICKNVLNEQEMALIETAFNKLLSNPHNTLFQLNRDDEGTTVEASEYSADHPAIRDVMEQTVLTDLASQVFGGGPVWYVGEQLWMKRGGRVGRTIWHQDSAFEPYSGAKSLVLWVPLESLAAENVLEVVRGSHAGVTYNATYATGKADEHVGIYDEATWNAPLIPDIEAERDKWDIFSAPMTRGDVLVFHENALHGGAPVRPGQMRRTLSFRLAGDDVIYMPRPPTRTKELYEEVKRQQGEGFHRALTGLKPGDLLSRGPNVRQVRA
jgi:hypothetical protein